VNDVHAAGGNPNPANQGVVPVRDKVEGIRIRKGLSESGCIEKGE